MLKSVTGAKKWVLTGAAAIGLALGAAGIAAAATGTATAPSTTNTASTADNTKAQDPAKLSHGPGETVLTGDTAAKVTAAAKSAVPGATIIRVETDSAGSPYEAHVKKSDGTRVTLKIDKNFKVTATEQGFGKGGRR